MIGEKMVKIIVSAEFSKIPGGRYISDGDYSGEEFRDKCLIPKFKSLKENQILLIDLDGAYGYPTSFLEEVFGGLARIFGPEIVLKMLSFKSDEEPSLIDEIKGYIENAKN